MLVYVVKDVGVGVGLVMLIVTFESDLLKVMLVICVIGDVGGMVLVMFLLLVDGMVSFGLFMLGLQNDYYVNIKVIVILMVVDALLSVVDLFMMVVGYLVNGAFSLFEVL